MKWQDFPITHSCVHGANVLRLLQMHACRLYRVTQYNKGGHRRIKVIMCPISMICLMYDQLGNLMSVLLLTQLELFHSQLHDSACVYVHMYLNLTEPVHAICTKDFSHPY